VDERKIVVFSNNMVNISNYIDFDVTDIDITEKVYYPVLKEILDNNSSQEDIKEALDDRFDELIPKHIMLSRQQNC
jgi:DNA-directed RNA polymerase subunit beta